MAIKELKPRIEKAMLKVREDLAGISGSTNPQIIEEQHKLEGQLLALTACYAALCGNNIYLNIISGD